MKRLIPTLILALITLVLTVPLNAFAEYQITLQWDANTDTNLQGYRLYMRTWGANYDYDFPEWEGATTQCDVPALVEDTVYYFVVRAYDTEGNESGDSNEVGVVNGTPVETPSSDPSTSLGGTGSATSSGAGGGCFISSLLNP